MKNREIKFRVWDTEDYCFKNIEWKFNKEQDILFYDGYERCFIENYGRYIIQQYTGLKDKTGREIYEGDIMALPLNSWHNNERRFIQEVPSITELFNEQYDESIKDRYDHLEIIGNIFENIDLMKS